MNISDERMADLFNEWKNRWLKDPNSFDSEYFEMMDDEDSYGQCAVKYIKYLDGELEK